MERWAVSGRDIFGGVGKTAFALGNGRLKDLFLMRYGMNRQSPWVGGVAFLAAIFLFSFALVPAALGEEGDNQNMDQYKALRDFQRSMDESSEMSQEKKSFRKNSDSQFFTPPAKEEMSDPGKRTLLKQEKDSAKKGPWYKRTFQTLGITLEDAYIYQLPVPQKPSNSALTKNGGSGVDIKVNARILPWKFFGERLVDGTKKYIWVTALQAKRQREISVFLNDYDLDKEWVAYLYGSEEEFEANNYWYTKKDTNELCNISHKGDTVYIELHSADKDLNPLTHPLFKVDWYHYIYQSNTNLFQPQAPMSPTEKSASCAVVACNYKVTEPFQVKEGFGTYEELQNTVVKLITPPKMEGCTGTLINANDGTPYVLTTGHCIGDRFDILDNNSLNTTFTWYNNSTCSTKISANGGALPLRWEAMSPEGNDIAIIKLLEPVPFIQKARYYAGFSFSDIPFWTKDGSADPDQISSLPPTDKDKKVKMLHLGMPSESALEVTFGDKVKIVGDLPINDYHSFKVVEGNINNGSSGGPLFVKMNNHNVVAGYMSRHAILDPWYCYDRTPLFAGALSGSRDKIYSYEDPIMTVADLVSSGGVNDFYDTNGINNDSWEKSHFIKNLEPNKNTSIRSPEIQLGRKRETLNANPLISKKKLWLQI